MTTARRAPSAGRRAWAKTAVGIAVVGLYLFPIYWMVVTSLKARPDILAEPWQLLPSPLTLEAYQRALVDNTHAIRALGNSVLISLGTVVLTLALAVPAAYAIARTAMRLRGGLVLLILVAQLLPSIVFAGPLFVILRTVGLTNTHAGLILADTTISLPFAVIVLRPLIRQIPREIEEAALVDGCSLPGAIVRVVLPSLRPGLITVAAFSFLLTWGEFVFGLSLADSDAVYPATVLLGRVVSQYGTDWGQLMAIASILAFPVIVIFAVLQRYVVSGVTAGSVKD